MNTTVYMSPESFDELYARFKEQVSEYAPRDIRIALGPRTFVTRLLGVEIYVSDQIDEDEIFVMAKPQIPRVQRRD